MEMADGVFKTDLIMDFSGLYSAQWTFFQFDTFTISVFCD